MSIAKWLLARKLAYNPPLPPVIKRVTGNPIELTDAASAPLVKCVTEIQGSQDLHGYDKPWVGGAGSNKWDEEWEQGGYDANGLPIASNSRIRSKNPIPVMPSTTYRGICTSKLAIRVYYFDASDNHISNEQVNNTAFTTPSDVSYIHFMSSSAYGTTYNNDIAINYPSTVTTFSPYSNICPITAYTEGSVSVHGKNLFDKNATGIVVDKYLNHETGYLRTSSSGWDTSDYIPVIGGETLTISGIGTSQSSEWCSYDSNKVFISGVSSQNRTYTVPLNARYIRVDYKGSNTSTVQVEAGSSATTYEPFSGNTTHTTTFTSAIYRGSEDVVNGTETHDMVKKTFDGTESWTKYDTGQGTLFRYSVSGIKPGPQQTVTPNLLCSHYPTVPNNARTDKTISQTQNGTAIDIIDNDYSDTTTLAAAMVGMEIVYELSTPTTSSVTPTNLPIKSLSGYNHIESSTGDMVLDYITDQYQNFVDTVESALPNTRKGGTKAMDVFLSLEKRDDDKAEVEKEAVKEEVK